MLAICLIGSNFQVSSAQPRLEVKTRNEGYRERDVIRVTLRNVGRHELAYCIRGTANPAPAPDFVLQAKQGNKWAVQLDNDFGSVYSMTKIEAGHEVEYLIRAKGPGTYRLSLSYIDASGSGGCPDLGKKSRRVYSKAFVVRE